MTTRRIALAVMAHPDDIEFLCAGSLARLHEKGWIIHLATMTAGDCGSETLPPETISCVRLREAQTSAKILRASYSCLGFLDLQIVYDAPALRKVVELIRGKDPSIVFTHSPNDYIVDHEMTAQLVRSAAFGAPAPNFKTASLPSAKRTRAVPHLYYADAIEGKDLMGEPVRPHFSIDVSTTMKTKQRMLRCHASQRAWLRAHHGMDEYVESMMRWSAQRGREAGTTFAEAFQQHLGHGYPQRNLLGEVLGAINRKALK